jgi:type III restriction enzyme
LTGEERDFIEFINSFINELKKKYTNIALLRNERFFQIFDFDRGRPFEPDFVLLLKSSNHKILTYQIFIEPKGNQFRDSNGRFEKSQEGWKQKFLLEIEEKAKTDLLKENENFKLIGLPFYNEGLKNEFETIFKEKLLN